MSNNKPGIFSLFFFKTSGSFNLGVSRLLYYGIIFFLYIRMDFSFWGKIPDVLWKPIFLFDILSLSVPSPEILGILGYLWIITVFFSSIGFMTRVSTILAFLLGFYLLGLKNSFGYASHHENLMLLIFAILAFSKCGDGFSVDSLLKKRKLPSIEDNDKQSFEYTWPIILIRLIFVFTFCAAGMSKIRNSGFNWVTSDYLSSLFINKGFTHDRAKPLFDWLPFWLGSKPRLCKFLAGTTLFLEIIAPLAMLNVYLRIVIIPSLFLMVSGFWIVMGISFPQLLASFVFWIPWDKVIKYGSD